MEGEVLTLIDKLIACWSDWDSNEEYYLGVFAPNIVRSGGRSDGFRRLRGNERKIVTALRRQLSQREWQHLPALIAQRRIDKQKELDTARERAKILEEAADLLTNPAKHGCRHDERDSKAVKVPR